MSLWLPPPVDIADIGYDIILLVGQSNMSGRGAAIDTVRYDPVDTRIFQYGASGAFANVISQAVEPLAMIDTPSGMGPGLVFARWYVRTIPVNRSVLLVPSALGGTAFESGTRRWTPGYTPIGNNLYETAITQALGAQALGGARGRFVAMLWIQGETDGDNSVSQTTYASDLDSLIVGLRSRLSAPSLPFIVGQMVPEYLGSGTRLAIDAAHQATPLRVPKTAFTVAPTGMNNGDGNHFNAPGQRVIGKRMFDGYIGIITNAGTAGALIAMLSGAATFGSAITATVPGTGTVSSTVTFGSALAATASGVVSGVTTVGSTIIATASGGAMIDSIGVAAARAYSTRKLVSAYAGSAIRVRRSSDNTQQDIGFAGGDLDTASLSAFVGANSAFVTTWYDQSGNGRDLTQATTTAQPRIVNAGVTEVIGTKSAVAFTGASYLTSASAGMYAAGSMTALYVLNAPTQAATIGRLLAETSSTGANPQYAPLTVASTGGAEAVAFIRNDAATFQLNSLVGAPPDIFNGAAHQGSTNDSGSAVAQFTDAVAAKNESYTRTGTFTVNTFAVGALVRNTISSFFTGSIAEMVVWHGALSTGNRQAGELNQRAYYGTP